MRDVQARSMASMSAEERKKTLAAHYAEKFRCPELRHPVNYAEKNWSEEEYSGGCYVSLFPPGALTQFGREIRKPFRRVRFAGTETATYWIGYMEGAIQAGERAAREVLHDLGKVAESEIWRDEKEISPDFPEVPLEPMLIEKLLPSVPTFLFGCSALAAGIAACMAANLL